MFRMHISALQLQGAVVWQQQNGMAHSGSSTDAGSAAPHPMLNGQQVHGHKHRISLLQHARASDWARALQESIQAANIADSGSCHGVGADDCPLVPEKAYQDTVRELQEILSRSRAPPHAAELLEMFHLACNFCAAHAPDSPQLPASTQHAEHRRDVLSTSVPACEQQRAEARQPPASAASDAPTGQANPAQGLRLHTGRAHGPSDSARQSDAGRLLLPGETKNTGTGPPKQQTTTQAAVDGTARPSTESTRSSGTASYGRKPSWLSDLLGCSDRQSVDVAAPRPLHRP